MSKKDYELIAKVIHKQCDSALLAYVDVSMQEVEMRTIRRVTQELAIAMQNANMRFDYDRFLVACGVA